MRLLLFTSFLILFSLSSAAQTATHSSVFNRIWAALQITDYFTARDLLQQRKKQMSPAEALAAGAFVDNAFNQLEASEQKIDRLLRSYPTAFPDSVLVQLYGIRHQNESKLFRYKKAAETVRYILSRFQNTLQPKDAGDYRNSARIWTALANTAPQQVKVPPQFAVQLKRDQAGLQNLSVRADSVSTDFIFDTGANLSVVSQSTAGALQLPIVGDSIEVGAITGKKVQAQLAYAPLLDVAGITVRNAVFLVFPDSALHVPQIKYQIRGIIGFPIIEALGMVTITRDGKLLAGTAPHPNAAALPLALNNLEPMIRLDGKHFTFDTGANETLLYYRWFEMHKDSIVKNYKPTPVSFGGAGGGQSFNGYQINFTPQVGNKKLQLQKISLIADPARDKWRQVFGNIGQDFIKQFSAMTLDFKAMQLWME